jgi:hypothetical protein
LRTDLRLLALLLASAVLTACAPLTHSIVALDGADTGNLAAVAMLDNDEWQPLLVRGIDGHPIDAIRVPSLFRDWSFVVTPGSHRLWLSSVPHGHPFVPQTIRCYAMEVVLAPGERYILRDDPWHDRALLLRPGNDQPAAVGALVDKPFVFERACRWQ